MLLSRSRLRSCSKASSLSLFDSRSCSRYKCGTIVALFPAPAKLGRRYEPAKERLVFACGAELVGRKVESSDSKSDSDSGAGASSSEASSRSRASEACAIGEEADSDRLRDATLPPMFATGLGGVGMVSSLRS